MRVKYTHPHKLTQIMQFMLPWFSRVRLQLGQESMLLSADTQRTVRWGFGGVIGPIRITPVSQKFLSVLHRKYKHIRGLQLGQLHKAFLASLMLVCFVLSAPPVALQDRPEHLCKPFVLFMFLGLSLFSLLLPQKWIFPCVLKGIPSLCLVLRSCLYLRKILLLLLFFF